MRHTEDHRGQSFWDVFPAIQLGQVNISITLPLKQRGFHLHKNKVDYMFILSGEYLFVFSQDGKKFDTGIAKPGTLIMIPADTWHAYQNISKEPGCIVYHETAKSGEGRDDDHEMSLNKFKGWMK